MTPRTFCVKGLFATTVGSPAEVRKLMHVDVRSNGMEHLSMEQVPQEPLIFTDRYKLCDHTAVETPLSPDSAASAWFLEPG